MKENLVAVLITSYNHDKYIGETIDSILKQTYKNIKIVIVDDCSQDNSREIIQEYARKYPDKVHYIFNEVNMHVNRSFNRGLDYIKERFDPPYLATVASDDLFEKDKIKKQIKFIKKNSHLDCVSSRGSYIDDKGKIKGSIPLANLFKTSLFSKKDIHAYREYFYKNIVNNAPYMQSILFKFKAVYDTKMPIDSFADDFLFMAQFFNNGYKAGFLNEELWRYRVHFENTHKNNDYTFLIIDVIDRYVPKQYKKTAMFNQIFLYAIYQFFYYKNKSNGIRYFLFSLTFLNIDSIKFFGEKFFKGVKWAWRNR